MRSIMRPLTLCLAFFLLVTTSDATERGRRDVWLPNVFKCVNGAQQPQKWPYKVIINEDATGFTFNIFGSSITREVKFTCKRSTGWTGAKCEISQHASPSLIATPTTSQPQEARCVNGVVEEPGACQCSKNWRGTGCELRICENGGTPTDDNTACRCTEHFEGQFCDVCRHNILEECGKVEKKIITKPTTESMPEPTEKTPSVAPESVIPDEYESNSPPWIWLVLLPEAFLVFIGLGVYGCVVNSPLPEYLLKFRSQVGDSAKSSPNSSQQNSYDAAEPQHNTTEDSYLQGNPEILLQTIPAGVKQRSSKVKRLSSKLDGEGSSSDSSPPSSNPQV